MRVMFALKTTRAYIDIGIVVGSLFPVMRCAALIYCFSLQDPFKRFKLLLKKGFRSSQGNFQNLLKRLGGVDQAIFA